MTLQGTLIRPQTTEDSGEARKANPSCGTQDPCPTGWWKWSHGGDDSCRERSFCTPPDANMCPGTTQKQTYKNVNPQPRGLLSANHIDRAFKNDPLNGYLVRTPQPVVCTYPRQAVQTWSDIQTWMNNFGKDEAYWTNIMPQFCFQKSTQCQPNPFGEPQNQCSRFSSSETVETDQGRRTYAAICDEWARNVLSKGDAQHPGGSVGNAQIQLQARGALDVGMNQFCNLPENRQLAECSCIQRASDPVYQTASAANPILDHCWWKACQNPEQFFIPADMQDRLGNPSTCPSNICQQVITGRDFASLGLDHAQLRLSCNIGGGGDGKSGDDTTDGKDDKPKPTTTGFPWWGWILIVVGLLLVVGIALFFILGKKRPTTSLIVQGPQAPVPIPGQTLGQVPASAPVSGPVQALAGSPTAASYGLYRAYDYNNNSYYY